MRRLLLSAAARPLPPWPSTVGAMGRRALAAAALAALALTGCGGGGGEATTTAGSKAPAPGVPTSPHGDNSIQTWGLEASSARRAQAAAFLRAYLDARATGAWAKVCSDLAARPRAEQERFGGGAPCAEAMASFAAHASPAALREEAQIEVLSFRVGRRYTFLIYRRPDGVFAMPLAREGGRLKLLLATPEPLG